MFTSHGVYIVFCGSELVLNSTMDTADWICLRLYFFGLVSNLFLSRHFFELSTTKVHKQKMDLLFSVTTASFYHRFTTHMVILKMNMLFCKVCPAPCDFHPKWEVIYHEPTLADNHCFRTPQYPITSTTSYSAIYYFLKYMLLSFLSTIYLSTICISESSPNWF